jgi:DNA segregation ATPase FtsK/SpoIIIE, S-DNA-T family
MRPPSASAPAFYRGRKAEVDGDGSAARLIERMEEENIISKPNHKGLREVLLPEHEEDR